MVFGVVLLVGVSLLVWTQYSQKPQPIPQEVFCTADVKQCPDGSYVGRTGPNCEFTKCPEFVPETVTLPEGYTLESYKVEKVLEMSCVKNSECETPAEYRVQSRCPFTSLCLQNKCAVVCPDYVDASWKTVEDEASGLTFRYPEKLSTQYIDIVDWPPEVQVLNEAFECIEAGNEIDRAGETEKRIVDDRNYCVTRKTEGAAGSMYTQYAYAFPKDNTTVTFIFTLRSQQCANYDELKKTECENERESFDVDNVVDKMAKSVK